MKTIVGNKIKFSLILLVLTVVTVFTWAQRHSFMPERKQSVRVTEVKEEQKELVYDPALVEELKDVCAAIDGKAKEYFISGSISTLNDADSLSAPKSTEYIFSKHGNRFYYKLGENETINGNGVYLFVDHEAKKVILSDEKKVISDRQPVNISSLAENLKSESYSLSAVTRGSKRTITLQNEYHITCKQYSITFDTLSRQAERVYCRLTNVEEPLRKDNEKLFDFRIHQVGSKSQISKYLAEEIVTRNGKEYQLTNKYKDYELLYSEEE